MENTTELEIIVPISLELDWPTKVDAIASIRELQQKYGLNRFALAFPGGGWRSSPIPPQEDYFREKAQQFREIKDELASEGIICGWWITYKATNAKIFLPTSGGFSGENNNQTGKAGFFWSSNNNGRDPENALYFYISNAGTGTSTDTRFTGYSIRPVCDRPGILTRLKQLIIIL